MCDKMQTNREAKYSERDDRSPNTAQEVGSWSQRTHFIDHYRAACVLDHFGGYLASQERVKHWQTPHPALAWRLPDPRGAGAPRWRLCLGGTQWHQPCFHTTLQPSASLAVAHNQVRSHVCIHGKITGFPLFPFPLNAGLDSPVGTTQINLLLVHKKVHRLHGHAENQGWCETAFFPLTVNRSTQSRSKD